MGTPTPDGLLLVDKPAGMTSHDVVAAVRRALGARHVGHAGTLDPFATGLLVLLTGRGTRLIPYLDAEPKVYDATIRFGAATDTDDATGSILRQAPIPSKSTIDAAILRLTGTVDQVPPDYSAKQVGGVRAYAAARRGTPLALAPVRVHVGSWVVRAYREREIDVTIACSGGTYVRALARDLGVESGSAACLVALRRIRSGAFEITDAVPPDACKRTTALRPLRDAVRHLPEQALDDGESDRVTHGRPVPARVAGPRVLLTQHGALVALGVRAGDEWQPRVVLREPVGEPA